MDRVKLLEVSRSWKMYWSYSSSLLSGVAVDHHLHNKDFAESVRVLCRHGLLPLVADSFLNSLEKSFKKYESAFWKQFDDFVTIKELALHSPEGMLKVNKWVQCAVPRALEEICSAKVLQEEYLSILAQAMQSAAAVGVSTRSDACCTGVVADESRLFPVYQTSVTALLLTSVPKHFPEVLNLYFKSRLEEFSKISRSGAVSPDTKSDPDKDSVQGLPVTGDISENDEMASTSSRHTSSVVEDMEINGNLFSAENLTSNLVDQNELHDMEDVIYPMACDGTRNTQEVADVASLEWISEISGVVQKLRSLGFAAMTEDAYASAMYSLLKEKIHSVATKNYEKPVLRPIRQWIKTVLLQFLHIILGPDSLMSEAKAGYSPLPSPLATTTPCIDGCDDKATDRVIRWHLRLEFFAYETLGDLRISELFDIIVDYPESLPALEDLRLCLASTGQHSKLVECFRSALRSRLLTAGAATTDILLQYVSTIKALRTMDPTGVFLEAVREPIREYLRGRKDTIRCVVTMLTDDTGTGASSNVGPSAESLLEELSRGTTALDNADSDDEGVADDDEAWANAKSWEPDPVEADPSQTSKSRRSMDIIGMLVGIYGSKELFVNEYRVMLAEKLLNKADYDIDREIRTLELLKLRFGESSMHGCEIMLKDIADSKRINSNIKASATGVHSLIPRSLSPTPHSGEASYSVLSSARIGEHGSRLAAIVARARGVFSQPGQEAVDSTVWDDESKVGKLPLDILDTTIISSLFWPPLQTETIKVPAAVDSLLQDYADRYHALKAPRKLQWKNNLGIVKLELQFENHSAQFVVSPLHASIIALFDGCPRWTSTDLSAAIGVPVTTLRRRILLWVNQGVLVESPGGKEGELIYTVVENIADNFGSSHGVAAGASESVVPLLVEDEGESGVTSMEDQLQQEMNVYESYVVGMLTNFDALPLDRIHNMLKMFVSDPPYDKTFQQLQGFLARLVSEEKLEIRDGMYRKRN